MRSKLEPLLPKPPWLKVKLQLNDNFVAVDSLLKKKKLSTVCREARCPNIFECWGNGTATFLIMGDICTRFCTFCAVEKGKPGELDEKEPFLVAEAVKELKLKHVVITSVNRDDLPLGGASHFAATIKTIRKLTPYCTIEVLIPDFQGNLDALKIVLEASPSILSHNMETANRLYKRVRPFANYDSSLRLLKIAAQNNFNAQTKMRTKSGIMVGLGETKEEIIELFNHLRDVNCDILTIGQYLRPTIAHHVPVEKYYTPEEFLELKGIASSQGFLYVESGPLVRSSYHAHKHVLPQLM